MRMRKFLVGICSLVMLSGGMLNAFAAAPPDWSQMPKNFDFYRGDLSENYVVDVTDIVIMQKYLSGKLKFSERYFQIADMNQDDAVNIYDFILLKKAVLSGEWDTALKESESDNFITPSITPVLHNLASQGTGNLVIFYVDFPECQHEFIPDTEQLNQIAFGEQDASNPNYPFESLNAFFERSSKGAMHLTGQSFYYIAKNEMSYYEYDKDALAAECYAAFDEEIDFSQFDGDGDGKIDATLINVPMSDGGDEWNGPWWSKSGSSGYEEFVADGMKIGHLITGNTQLTSIEEYNMFNATYQHEVAHCFGLPDYYLYYSEDYNGFHGEEETAALELMDDSVRDLCCFSKLQLGWYKENQVSVYDQNQGGEQVFTLNNAQTEDGNCLILPCGELDYYGEYLILEYITPEGNNLNSVYPWMTVGNGIRAYHVKADLYDNGWWTWYKYASGSEFKNYNDDGIRLIRLVNDAEGGYVFITGDVLDGNISGWHWYAEDESESAETGYTVTVGELKDGAYTITVNKQ